MERNGENRIRKNSALIVAAACLFSQLFWKNLLLSASNKEPAWQPHLEQGRATFHEARYLEALEHFRRALGEAEQAGPPSAELRGRILTSMGACLLLLTRYKAALAQFLEARPYVVTGGNRDHLSVLDGNIATVYLYQGEAEMAARMYGRALGWLAGRPRSPHRSALLANLGVIELREGRFQRALSYEQEALGLVEPPGESERRAAIHDLIGIARLGQRDYNRASESFDLGLGLRRGLGERADLSRSWMYLGRVERERGNAAAALEWLERSVAEAGLRGNPLVLWQALYLRGQSHRDLEKPAAALADFRNSVEVLESTRRNLVPTDALRVGFEVAHHEVYAALAGLLSETGSMTEAFRAVEMGRAQSLRELVWNRQGAAADGELSLWMRYADRLARLEGARARAASAPDTETARSWHRRTAEQEADLRDFEARLKAEDPVLSSGAFAPAQGLEQVQQALDPDSLLLSFYTGAKGAYLWAATREQARFYRLPPPSTWIPWTRRFLDGLQGEGDTGRAAGVGGVASVGRAVGARRPGGAARAADAGRTGDEGPAGGAGGVAGAGRAAGAARDGGARRDADAGRAAGAGVYEALLGQVDPGMLERRHWVLAVEGDLASLPFAALPAPSGRYLAEERALSYTPSASLLQSLRERGGGGYDRDFLGVADPVVNRADPRGAGCGEEQPCLSLPRLVSSEAEARSCARLFGEQRSTILAGLAASEGGLREAARLSHRYWHFASHVVVDTRRPNHSFIALSNPDRLTVFDIAGLPVRAEMVVINGCDSGTGKSLPGAGVLGLARAFLAAGARSVCATRWKIPEEGGALVRRFYAHLREAGTGRAEALRRAQVDMIRARDWRSQPRYWAAYFLVGDGGSR